MPYLGVRPADITSATEAEIAGDLTVDTNTLFVDASANEVGIGTTTPATYTDHVGSSNAPSVVVAGSQPSYVLADTDISGNDGTLGITKAGEDTVINNLGAGTIKFFNNGAERMRLLSSGGVDLSAGNLVLDNGYGIDFSATANSSGTVTHEILDDYELGSYTPTVDGGISGVSYSAQVGRYTRVGNLVTFVQHIDVASNSGTSSGQLQLGGLPFTAVNTSNVWGSAWWVYTGGGYNLDTTHITWAIQGGTTRIIAYKNSGAVFQGNNISDANAGFHLAGFYYV